ncbi:cysteine--tRNA ligase [Conexibacter sp. JD483]|uniref:cysteine--tRNA ligase n=1 Tax=unclassified Conexibacter TaxID=2627773 RepID=UPI002716A378|nr:MULTISPECIES: cysteine--tRNA ligase [unclassified Conexibacter]MDO8189054.1 cysteine--tRNA ligase [Conexibacter sp. CPCC 205706]MDO8201321.1 cysteine--tRNA ligase [Conexibacter sp. CPCC 205762]MDR9371667.1 cysteine--tRNA ligase [Conexibacter sp. JD483]
MTRTITIHDTLSGRVLPLEPRDPGRVSIYACGPTVYGRVHVGNARPFVVFSLFKRFLEHEGFAVTFVANVTDVNDKIYDAARAAGVPSEQLATEMTAHYVADTDGLGLGRPDHEPKARATIAEMVALIERLIERGHAYAVEGDVYFDVRSYPRYGELSHRDVEQMDQGEGKPDPTHPSLKRDPLDFALWKAWKEGEDTSWETPWGRGRPGWHIECSAMAEQLLGVGFDVHGGGSDLVFPHHENEAAQTCAAHGESLARIWMHNGMVRLDGEKMAKSVGNIFLLHEALATHGRDALVLFFVGGHYRQPISYSGERLEEAGRAAQRIRELGRRLSDGAAPAELAPLREQFFAALADDFNTPRALALVFDWVRGANRLLEAGETVGGDDLRELLQVLALDTLLDGGDATDGPDEAAQELLVRREAARAARDFAAADALRDELTALGWTVRDGAAGPELVPNS